MNNDILDFISRRFSITQGDTCNWMTKNSYYFARILKARFKGEIWIDLNSKHFLFKHCDFFFDWSGIRTEYNLDKPETIKNLMRWSFYKEVNREDYDRICREVID